MLFQIVLFFAASAIAALIAFLTIRRTSRGSSISRAITPFVLLGLPIAILGLLSALHARGEANLGWLFGTETADVGPIEFGTVFGFATAMVLSISHATVERGLNRLVYVFLACACFFVAGEEVSWGQWIFHWDTPDALAEANLQGETNLHNLIGPRFYDPLYSVAGFGLLGLALIGALTSISAGVIRRTAQLSGFLPVSRFVSWASLNVYGLTLVLASAVLLQHESFEEFSEFVLSAALALFLFQTRETAVTAGVSSPNGVAEMGRSNLPLTEPLRNA